MLQTAHNMLNTLTLHGMQSARSLISNVIAMGTESHLSKIAAKLMQRLTASTADSLAVRYSADEVIRYDLPY